MYSAFIQIECPPLQQSKVHNMATQNMLHMFNNIRQLRGCLAMSIIEDGEEYHRKGINWGMTSKRT